MKNNIVVRPARAEDKDAILSFCINTFSWGDYIHEIWDHWLVDERGKMFVGVAGEKPVGLIHVALMNDGAAWMEGMRVHPDYRRLGVSSTLDTAGRDYARECGCRLARLATSIDNLTAQRTLQAQHYQRTARFIGWKTHPRHGRFDTRLVVRAPLEIVTYWHDTLSPLIARTDWKWEVLDGARLEQLSLDGNVRTEDGGLSIICETMDASLCLFALVGNKAAALKLARAARAEAAYRGYALVEALLIDEPLVNRVLKRAGFKQASGMFVYETAL